MATGTPARLLEHELAVLLRRARSMSSRLARQVHPDLEPRAYDLMLHMAQGPGARAADLASDLGISKPGISRQLAKLERLGSIERSHDGEDTRTQLVTLTAAGAAQVDKVRAARQAHVHAMVNGWTPEGIKLFANLLGRLNDTLLQAPVSRVSQAQ